MQNTMIHWHEISHELQSPPSTSHIQENYKNCQLFNSSQSTLVPCMQVKKIKNNNKQNAIPKKNQTLINCLYTIIRDHSTKTFNHRKYKLIHHSPKLEYRHRRNTETMTTDSAHFIILYFQKQFKESKMYYICTNCMKKKRISTRQSIYTL